MDDPELHYVYNRPFVRLLIHIHYTTKLYFPFFRLPCFLGSGIHALRWATLWYADSVLFVHTKLIPTVW